MAAKNEVNFKILQQENGTTYKGGYNGEIDITSTNSQINTYFNIDVQQSAYFTMLIEGFDYGRFHTQVEATTPAGATLKNGRHDFYYDTDPTPDVRGDGSLYYNNMKYKDNVTPWVEQNTKYFKGRNGTWMNFNNRRTEHWLPLKSLQYSQGSIETLSLAAGTFSNLMLPFRKQSPTLTVEMYDHRSDFFEMKLREWHSKSVLTFGYVPVLDNIKKHVVIMGFSTNGDCNYRTECDCILIDDITTSRDYASNDLKVISFKLLIIGYGLK